VIAIFYSKGFALVPFIGAVCSAVIYWLLQKRRVRSPWIYVPLAVATWGLLHASGVHATVAGVVLALLTRIHLDPGESAAPADRLQRMILPWSAGLCVPLFAFFAAGVDLRNTGLAAALLTPVGVGILLGLVVGKPLGVVVTAWLTARFTRASLSPEIAWRDVAAVGLLAGIGFTVALLITELAYGEGALLGSAKVGVLSASVLAAVLAAVTLLSRNRHYRRVAEAAGPDVPGEPGEPGEPG
jgi:NhaA family Na+:H+ antiporter